MRAYINLIAWIVVVTSMGCMPITSQIQPHYQGFQTASATATAAAAYEMEAQAWQATRVAPQQAANRQVYEQSTEFLIDGYVVLALLCAMTGTLWMGLATAYYIWRRIQIHTIQTLKEGVVMIQAYDERDCRTTR